jgi:hypothetical protein
LAEKSARLKLGWGLKIYIDMNSLQAQVNREIPTIHAKMDHIQDQISSQIVEVHFTLNQFMKKLQVPSSYEPPLYIEGVDSNHPLHSHSNTLHHDPDLSRVEVKKYLETYLRCFASKQKHQWV